MILHLSLFSVDLLFLGAYVAVACASVQLLVTHEFIAAWTFGLWVLRGAAGAGVAALMLGTVR